MVIGRIIVSSAVIGRLLTVVRMGILDELMAGRIRMEAERTGNAMMCAVSRVIVAGGVHVQVGHRGIGHDRAHWNCNQVLELIVEYVKNLVFTSFTSYHIF